MRLLIILLLLRNWFKLSLWNRRVFSRLCVSIGYMRWIKDTKLQIISSKKHKKENMCREEMSFFFLFFAYIKRQKKERYEYSKKNREKTRSRANRELANDEQH